MGELTSFELKLAELICEVLNLEDLKPDDIGPEEPLFINSGLGLDSIDALEIAVAVAQEFNVHLKAESEESKEIFATLRSLAAYIDQEAAGKPA